MGLAAMATTARGMAATVRVLGRGELGRFTGGDRSEVARIESELAGFLGTPHALAVNSGTSALVAALVAFVVAAPATGVALAVALTAGAVWAVVLRRRGRLHDLGVYDETVASDVWGRAR